MTFPPSLYIVLVKTFQHTLPISRDIPQELLKTNIISEAMLEREREKTCGSGVSNAVISNSEHF